MRVAVVTDSNSGITQSQGREQGIYVVPMPFMVKGEMFFEDIDLNQEQFYIKLEEGADISTSQPSPESVMKIWDRALMDYGEVVHIPMSSGLSGSCQTAMILAQEYNGRVQVVNNQRISVTQRQSALDAKAMSQKGMPASLIREKLEQAKFDSSIYITVDTLKYLKKGGRITPAAAALGTLLKIKPVLTIQGEKLDAFSKARTIKQAKSIMMAAMEKDLKTRFHDSKAVNGTLQIAHSNNENAAQEFRKELMEIYPEADIYVDHLSLSIACHIGPGSLAIAYSGKIND